MKSAHIFVVAMPLTLLKASVLLVILLCSPVLAQNSSDPQLHLNQGEEYLRLNKYDEAIKEFQQALRIKPKWPEAYFKLGTAYSAIPIAKDPTGKNLGLALKAFEDAVELKPDWPEALTLLGEKYLTFKQYDKAIRSLKKAIALKPDLVDAHENLGIAYLYSKHFREGVNSLEEAVRLKPEYSRPHKLLGLGYLVLDEREKALEQYRILQSLDVEMANYLNNAIQSPDKPTFGLTNGKLISVPKPHYPDVARKDRISGTVTVEVAIDEQGAVTHARAIKGPMELYDVSEAAAIKARFTPTLLSGTPVKVKGILTFNFVP